MGSQWSPNHGSPILRSGQPKLNTEVIKGIKPPPFPSPYFLGDLLLLFQPDKLEKAFFVVWHHSKQCKLKLMFGISHFLPADANYSSVLFLWTQALLAEVRYFPVYFQAEFPVQTGQASAPLTWLCHTVGYTLKLLWFRNILRYPLGSL